MPIPVNPELLAKESDFTYVRPDGLKLRGQWLSGSDPLMVFIHGFRSSHRGDKAEALSHFAAKRGIGFLRLDHLGHGMSDGHFEDFRISETAMDIGNAIASIQPKGVILIGSSLGALIALCIARKKSLPILGMMLIAPACHFISHHPAAWDAAVCSRLQQQGFIETFDSYSKQSYRIYQAMIEDALNCEPPTGEIELPMPVHLVHGSSDDSVPYSESEDLHRRIAGSHLLRIEGGDHRLSRHIPLILDELERMLSEPPLSTSRH